MSNYASVKSGVLLVAEPFMWDPNFRRSVILVCAHNEEEGTFGFIINRPLKLKINDLVPDFPKFNATVFFGGPVDKELKLNYLHNLGELIEDSLPVMPGIWWGGNYEKLKFLVDKDLVKPENIRFVLGYAGWDPGQVAEEMAESTWIVAEADPNYLFGKPKGDMWEHVLQNKGDSFSIISELPEIIIWN